MFHVIIPFTQNEATFFVVKNEKPETKGIFENID